MVDSDVNREAAAGNAASQTAVTTARQLRLTLISSVVGTALEWYDFYLYGTAAALIFNHLFFPQLSPLSGTLAAFASYGVGFLVRPLGGLFWGYIGDKYGRRPVLIGTLVLMGISTTAIGLLPGYGSIGFAAPLLLTLLRLLQGFGAGAEFSSAITLNAEKAAAHRRGYYASWSGVGIGCGVLLSVSAFALAQQLPQASFIAWGWRIPFLLSILAVLVGGAIRLYVTESPIFNKLEQRHQLARAPFITVWQTQRRHFFVALGARMAENTAGFFLQVWSLSYVTQTLHVPNVVPVTGVLLGSGIGCITIPPFGALSDRAKPVYIGGAILFGVGMFPYFWLLNTGNPLLIILAIIAMIALANYSMFSVQAAYFAELFNSATRVTAISMSWEISSIFAGGLAPIIASSLLLWSNGNYAAVAWYMVALSVITVVALCYGPETRGCSLDDH
ncbi:MFS transporter [Sodalis sp.]|uniref:MFS transporter n=1 Tax=Sodalis sp. (in: enterobacteria) TaxID=1898979 RepID=UPI0038739587